MEPTPSLPDHHKRDLFEARLGWENIRVKRRHRGEIPERYKTKPVFAKPTISRLEYEHLVVWLQMNPSERKRRGEAREDGKLFWAYGRKYSFGECWMSPEAFVKQTARRKLARKTARKKNETFLNDPLVKRVKGRKPTLINQALIEVSELAKLKFLMAVSNAPNPQSFLRSATASLLATRAALVEEERFKDLSRKGRLNPYAYSYDSRTDAEKAEDIRLMEELKAESVKATREALERAEADEAENAEILRRRESEGVLRHAIETSPVLRHVAPDVSSPSPAPETVIRRADKNLVMSD